MPLNADTFKSVFEALALTGCSDQIPALAYRLEQVGELTLLALHLRARGAETCARALQARHVALHVARIRD